MKITAIVLGVLAAAQLAMPQRHKPSTINTETPEGALLQLIGTEQDDAKKLALLEDFASRYPKHEGLNWVYELMVDGYTKARQFDKALDAGEKLVAADPQAVEAGHACLKAAEAKKDPDLILKWSNLTSEMARKVAALPKPAEEDDVDDWKRRVDYAKQVDIYTEYSLFATMLATQDPKKKIDLAEALEKRNPDSQYLPQMSEPWFQAYMQPGGDQAKGIALAERLVEKNQGTAEMMLAVAGGYMGKKQPEKVVEFSKKAIAAAEAKPKPEGVADANWANWKGQIAGRAHWMTGVTLAGQSKWSQADQELRAALPGITESKEMQAQALFYLGVANYRMAVAGDTERARDALKFSDECAAIPGPFQAPARQNSRAIKTQYHVQ